MLEVKYLTFSYKRKSELVLRDFSLSIPAGRIYGLLGKNGAGKSTLLHLICGLLTPRSGHVYFKGVDTRLRRPDTLNDIFIVPEEFELPGMKLTEYLRCYSAFYPRFSNEDMNRYLDVFGISADVNLQALSMGQKKKVFMSFALATNTSLLLMDEPTNGLDIPSKSEFRKLIASGINEERSIFISTHQVRDIDKILDHVLIVDHSKVLLDRSVYEITDRLYFGETDQRQIASEALYQMSSIKGYSILQPNEEKHESEMNLEVLFNAVLEHPDQIAACFTTK